jgi:hypothetical protein
MRNRFSRGETVRLFLDVITAGAGVTALAPTIAIQRLADGKWFQDSDRSWQATIVDNPMVQTDATNFPGRYHFDFNHDLDDLQTTEFVAKKANSAAPVVLEYEDLTFGKLSAATEPALCSITGTIFTPNGKAARVEYIRATLIPVFKDAQGRGVQSDRVMLAATDENGDFSLPLVRGGVFRLEIPSIGYDRKVTIPNEASALFTDL